MWNPVVLSIVAYSFCSGSLVLLNKLILHHLPYPSLVVSFQLVATLIFIYVAKYSGSLPVDDLRWEHVKPYLYYTVAFACGVYSNMRSLAISNVETVIVFRALSPCIVAVLDFLFLGRTFPAPRSVVALLTIVLGAYGYACHDVKFQTQGYAAYVWPFLYLCVISFEMCYGKRIIGSVDLKTKSGPVLYTNILGLWPMLLFAIMGDEFQKFKNDRTSGETIITASTLVLLVLGCITGTGIGYSSWWCRDQVSATTFTLIGVMNKCLTILVNLIIWDKHAPPLGIASLGLCLVGGALYQQAPMRKGESTTIHKKTKMSVQSSNKNTSNQEPDDDLDGVWQTDMTEFELEVGSDEEIELLDAQDGISRRR